MIIATDYTRDPQWFFASLAQVTGAVVGVFGGALIIRIQARRTDWRTARTTLQVELHKLIRKRNDPSTPEPGEETTAGAAKIDDLVSGLHRTPFPSELWGLAVFIVLLLGCGVLWPLVLLERPSSLTRWGLTLSIVLLAGAALLYFCCSLGGIQGRLRRRGAQRSTNKSESADSG